MSEAALTASNQNQAMQSLMQKDTNSAPGDLATELFKEYGVQNVLKSVTNAAADYLQIELNELIDSMSMPQFMKDDAKGQVNSVSNSYKSDTPNGVDEGVEKVLKQPAQATSGSGSSSQKAGEQAVSGVMDMVKKSMQDSTEQATKSGKSGGSGNWLAILARALGQTSGKALKSMIELGNKMGGIDSKANPETFAETQAEFQAQAQIFKMFQDAVGTMIKGIGEGMSAVARKQ